MNVVFKKNPGTITDRFFRIERLFPAPQKVYPDINKKGTDTMVPITEEEKRGPLYKYFIRDMVESPDPSKYAQTQDPLDFPEKRVLFILTTYLHPAICLSSLATAILPTAVPFLPIYRIPGRYC
jgi:hypothetical protein